MTDHKRPLSLKAIKHGFIEKGMSFREVLLIAGLVIGYFLVKWSFLL